MPLHDARMKPGGSDGGTGEFIGGLGLLLTALGLYLFLDSVRVTSDGAGMVSSWLHGGTGWDTASKGIVFLPFFAGVVALFFDSKMRLGWWLLGTGVAIILLEILSRLRFVFDMKTSHLVLILTVFFGGIGLVLRSFRQGAGSDRSDDEKLPPPQ